MNGPGPAAARHPSEMFRNAVMTALRSPQEPEGFSRSVPTHSRPSTVSEVKNPRLN